MRHIPFPTHPCDGTQSPSYLQPDMNRTLFFITICLLLVGCQPPEPSLHQGVGGSGSGDVVGSGHSSASTPLASSSSSHQDATRGEVSSTIKTEPLSPAQPIKDNPDTAKMPKVVNTASVPGSPVKPIKDKPDAAKVPEGANATPVPGPPAQPVKDKPATAVVPKVANATPSGNEPPQPVKSSSVSRSSKRRAKPKVSSSSIDRMSPRSQPDLPSVPDPKEIK